jgi:hypothetical protein
LQRHRGSENRNGDGIAEIVLQPSRGTVLTEGRTDQPKPGKTRR